MSDIHIETTVPDPKAFELGFDAGVEAAIEMLRINGLLIPGALTALEALKEPVKE